VNHAETRLLAAGAALDDLDPAEREAWEAHLDDCSECDVLVDELSMVLADVSLLVPERVPPANLFAGIRAAIGAENAMPPTALDASPPTAPLRVPAPLRASRDATPAVERGSAATGGGPTRTVVQLDAVRAARRVAYAAIGLAAVLAIAAVGLGARTAALQDSLDRSSAQVAVLRDRIAAQGGVMSAAMNPAHVTVALHPEPLAPTADASVVYVPGTESAWLVAQHLPATPAGHAYQLWYADAAGVHPLQTAAFDGNGTFVAPLDVDLSSSSAVMVTLEQAGGSQGAPGEQVVFGDL
jgi:hypothetical protein